jgi:uncharacterized protein DUF4261
MEAPIPKGELQRVCELAWYWAEACAAIKDHKAHFLVVLMGTNLDKLDSALLETKIVAAVMEESNAVAGYWGVNLQSRDVWVDGSRSLSRTEIPTTLWINYRVSRGQPGRLSMSTLGMKDFGLMEIETKDAPLPGLQLFDLMLGTTAYLIMNGPVIKNGDTIGQSPEQKIRVRHADSYWNAGEKVYRIQFGG